MANPSPYTIAYSFSGFQANNPATPLPAPQLDSELGNVSASIASIISALGSVRRADGLLTNGIVTYDSLAPALQTAGIAPANAWQTGIAYAANTNAIQSGGLYRCLVAHASGVFATDLAAGLWVFVANLAAAFAAGTNLQLVGSVFSVIPSPVFSGVPTAPTAAAGANSTQLATTAYLDSKLGAASGIATLDGGGKLTSSQIPAALVGAVVYQGTWNANTNTPALASGVGAKGNYYKVSVAGSTVIDGIGQWNIGDTIIFDGTTWDKIDGIASEVITVVGRFGNVTLAFTDFSGQATLAQLPTLAANTVLGSIAGGTPIALSTAQHTSLVNAFTTTLSGAVPAPGTSTGKLLRDDGTWVTAAGSGTVTNVATGDGLIGGPVTTTGTLAADPAIFRGFLAGLTLSTAGASATFAVSAGVAVDSTNAGFMKLAAAISKTTASWAVGTGNGALDTGAIANSTWYHVHEIKRTDTGVVDVLVSLSATAPTMPTSYTLFRRIGSMKTNGSAQWIKFIQDGDLFQWDVGVLDANAATLSTVSRTLITLSVPTGVAVTAMLGIEAISSANNNAVFLTDPAVTDTAASLSAFSFFIGNTSTSRYAAQAQCRTNTSAQIGVRGAFSDVYNLFTGAWNDTRGRFA